MSTTIKRKSLSKKLRFEIFERDNFTCQYCGVNPQRDDCVLQVDHIISVKNNGTNEKSNLITSCWDCNIGKGRKTTILPTLPNKELELEKVKERLAQVQAINNYQLKINKINNLIDRERYKPIEPHIQNLTKELKIKVKKVYDKYIDVISFEVFIKGINIAFSKGEYADDFMRILSGYLKQKKLEIENPELAEHNKQTNFLIYEMNNNFGYVNNSLVREYVKNYGLENVKCCYELSYSWSIFKSLISEI